jgi:hypothetical protein
MSETRGRYMSYDPKCYDLAELFLSDGLIGLGHEDRIKKLAQEIQFTIEDWIDANPPDTGSPPSAGERT